MRILQVERSLGSHLTRIDTPPTKLRRHLFFRYKIARISLPINAASICDLPSFSRQVILNGLVGQP